jgi:hypothetical protein
MIYCLETAFFDFHGTPTVRLAPLPHGEREWHQVAALPTMKRGDRVVLAYHDGLATMSPAGSARSAFTPRQDAGPTCPTRPVGPPWQAVG